MKAVRFFARDLTALEVVMLPDAESVQLWYVRGYPHYGSMRLWPTKIVAETMARVYFPDEDADTRYARIGYRVFNLED